MKIANWSAHPLGLLIVVVLFTIFVYLFSVPNLHNVTEKVNCKIRTTEKASLILLFMFLYLFMVLIY